MPLLVDADIDFGNSLNISRTVKSLIKFGAAAIHLEDPVTAKRCGHRAGKALIHKMGMNERIKAAVDRVCSYIEAGANMIFPEALTTLSQYHQFLQATTQVPVVRRQLQKGISRQL